MIFHVILHATFADVSGFYMWACSRSNAVLVGQHEADEDISQTHCHFMIDTNVTNQAIAKQLKSRNLSGQGKSCIMEKTQKTREPYDRHKLCVYILKGYKTTIYDTMFSSNVIERMRSEWVQPTKETSPAKPVKDKSEKTHWDLIQEIIVESKLIPGIWGTVLEKDQFGHIIHEEGVLAGGRATIFDIMVKVLNKNKVRTSRNELERFYVSIMRHDYHSRQLLRNSIMQNVFRE